MAFYLEEPVRWTISKKGELCSVFPKIEHSLLEFPTRHGKRLALAIRRRGHIQPREQAAPCRGEEKGDGQDQRHHAAVFHSSHTGLR